MTCCPGMDIRIPGDVDGQDVGEDRLLVGHGHPYPRSKK